ncbi:MAG: YraN family protein [Caulobacteraceae bacterium]|nr:YraN family protein [Caulobacter sp.]
MPQRSAPNPEIRRAALAAGWGAERAAVMLLRLKGYRILARRYLVRGGEIDVVAQRGSTIAFVEVKLRASLDDALISISAEKRRRVSRAARAFVSRQRATALTYRADAIYVAPWRWPTHVPAAFELDLG